MKAKTHTRTLRLGVWRGRHVVLSSMESLLSSLTDDGRDIAYVRQAVVRVRRNRHGRFLVLDPGNCWYAVQDQHTGCTGSICKKQARKLGARPGLRFDITVVAL